MKWNLKTLYSQPDEKIIRKDLENSLKKAKSLVLKYENLINENINSETAKQIFLEIEELLNKLSKPLQYTELLFSENTLNTFSQQLYSLTNQFYSKIMEIISPLNTYFAKLSNKKLEELAENIPEYSNFIKKILEEKKHILSKDAEKILAATSISRREAIAELYGKITSSYIFKIKIDGQVKKLTDSEVRALRKSPNSSLRKKAMKTLLDRYDKDNIVINGLYNLVVKDYDTEARLRNYNEPISMRNMENRVSDISVKKLIDITLDNIDLVHKYYNWKSDVMKETLTPADIYAPIGKSLKKYSFEEAKEIVLEAYYEFDEKVGNIIKEFFEEERIHSDITQGKIGGAFCAYYSPTIKPYILINFTGNISDVMALAHELGHGLHGVLSSKQTYLNYHTPLTMAELASVFGEFLVFEKLKNQLIGEERNYFIASKLEEIFATMFRQNMFVRFEIQAHNTINTQGMATWEELSKIYEKELQLMFGNSVKITPEYRYEWATIPHLFHTPFYVYAYNYANCLVIALYEKYLEEGKNFAPKYIELLESGGKNKPEHLLKKVGINIDNEDFWQKAFDFLNKMLKEII
ncbi:M3 family oligoendopeptidase [Thermosipho atlanticus]|uniref:Oligoendopeptidase F n=1 Tax=Thermosipho atlanticus DSM 15807 TaxID=1123380 RepID=A0A1M5TJ23_9BACT|nr:M3 family oligoendopeptidase [Thermosipho atlanticus]SHH50772.1 oligoendopeptidase F [Thermosipho atlanticus DSM 15807]